MTVGVYSDPACETPVDGKYFEGGTAGTGFTLTLTGDALEAMDETGNTQEMSFNIAQYIADAGLTEIPEPGVMLFVRARIEQQRDGKWVELPEADSRNNQKSLTFESLLARSENTPVTLSAELENGSAASAVVQVRNHSLQQRRSGTLTAALLDRNGALLETRTLDGLTLAAEQFRESRVTFSQAGARVAVRYGEASGREHGKRRAHHAGRPAADAGQLRRQGQRGGRKRRGRAVPAHRHPREPRRVGLRERKTGGKRHGGHRGRLV